MNIRVGFIPYLNMVPFQQGFGPQPLEAGGRRLEFHQVTPRVLGARAQQGTIDAGALSIVDLAQIFPHYEPLGRFGIGVRRAAHSVLFFSKRPIARFSGLCAVTEETSTSFCLLQLLLALRYRRADVRYGRIAAGALFDGVADGLLLIGDEALRAKRDGVAGLHHVADLGEEWFRWQGLPFVFARWAVRHGLKQDIKDIIETSIEKSLLSMDSRKSDIARSEGEKRGFDPALVEAYWNGFVYHLNPEHLESIRRFSELWRKQCLTA